MSEPLQTWALSTYPGERGLVEAHPSNYDAQWYRREDVDKRIAELRAELEAVAKTIRKESWTSDCLACRRFLESVADKLSPSDSPTEAAPTTTSP